MCPFPPPSNRSTSTATPFALPSAERPVGAEGLPLPLGSGAQRDVAALRSRARHRSAVSSRVRVPIRASWERSLSHGVLPDLREAPLAWDEAGLRAAVTDSSWLDLAGEAVVNQHPDYVRAGHILALLDDQGRMLWADGDPHVLEGLRRINFRPGGDWSEAAAGTNGPGTALAAGHPVHVIGREHFCEAWETWHCAAAPVRDPLTGTIRGVIDLSGRVEDAHPHTLALVSAMAAAVERGIAARDGVRNAQVLREMARIVERWPGEGVVALDRAGRVLGASSRAGPSYQPGATLPRDLQDALAEAGALEAASGEAVLDLPRGSASAAHGTARLVEARGAIRIFPLLDGADLAGACLLLGENSGSRWKSGFMRVPLRPSVKGAVDALPASSPSLAMGNSGLLGRSPELAEVRRLAERASSNPLPVLLLGESGTGKEVLARAIHRGSPRAKAPFVAVNCAAVPGELAVGEFFGHVAGAFSGALREGREGHFVAADGGTLFLDEVGDLPLELQAALLRVLQERTVTPLGASRSRSVDVRIMAATNRDLPKAVKTGAFRRDLFHRLHVLSVELPPLRTRGDDVALLARHFLLEAELEQDRPGHVLDPEVLEAFRRWSWPGNVRELRNVMQRMVALAPGSRIGIWDLPAEIREPGWVVDQAEEPGAWPSPPTPLRAPEEGHLTRERRELEEAIRCSATMKEAAEQLGIGRSSLYRRLERHGLRPGRDVRRGEGIVDSA